MIDPNEQREKTPYGSELISMLSNDGRIMFLSCSHAAALGYTFEKLRGQCVFQYVHLRDVETVRDKFNQMMNTGSPTSVDYRFAHKSGKWVAVRSNGSPLMVDNAVEGFVIVSHTKIMLNLEDVMRAANG